MKRLSICLSLLVLCCSCSSTTSSIVPDPARVARYRLAGEPLRKEIADDLAAGVEWVQVTASALAKLRHDRVNTLLDTYSEYGGAMNDYVNCSYRQIAWQSPQGTSDVERQYKAKGR